MNLRLKNTLSNKTELFRSILPNKVSIYCCGVTVYDLCHLGHARSYIVWDILRRYLIWNDYKVVFIQNFTDIDDKILKRASEEGCTMEEISEKNIKEFHIDMDALGIMRPDKMPRATKCLDGIRLLIKQLLEKEVAYLVDGDVYFNVDKYKNYGKLSGRNLSEQQTNADGRITNTERSKKQNSYDFVLWKAAKEGEPSFCSSWGEGRPGWHIECSAMVREELGETIDIHLGGSDLVFPHHENEIAQSEALTGKELANYWLHNGMVNVSGQKMSKSLGNFTTIRELLKSGISPMTVRFFILQAHYRKPLDFTDQALKAAKKGWEGLNRVIGIGRIYNNELGWEDNNNDNEYISKLLNKENQLEGSIKKFRDSMDDDLNTAGALAIVFELARPLKKFSNELNNKIPIEKNSSEINSLEVRWQIIVRLLSILGFQEETSDNFTSKNIEKIDIEKIKASINARKIAKAERDFNKADKIRDNLRLQGIELIDQPGGETCWKLIK